MLLCGLAGGEHHEGYGSQECIPFEYLFEGKESPRSYEDLGEEEVLEEACTETELVLARPIDEDQEENGIEDVMDRLRSAAEESYQVDTIVGHACGR